ncbi:ABC-2 transporter permease [Paenibacillus aquistagni]|uniref:ABC-2 family transporter protein n=1 Tax=Paenibacillus aquistagni TaxID=1852522 RepID=A0A1X7J5E4_9BACL|nr:ABC-2 transporter permease [Paenibacillus aquistagni]SMG22911.1 ABC-2 family transporter protein [Paenibacillus aquistagni]
MLNLLRKDFIALKSSLWMTLLFLVVFSVAFIPKLEVSLYLVGIYTAFASLNLGTMIDIKNHNHKFLVTLPVNRKQLVQAKYIAAIIYTLFGVFASYGIHTLVTFAMPELHKPEYSAIDLLAPIGIMLILSAIYMPLFYSLSKKGAAIINVVFMIILIGLAQPTAIVMNMVKEKGISDDPMLILVLIGVLLLFAASYFLTVHLFKRKDF